MLLTNFNYCDLCIVTYVYMNVLCMRRKEEEKRRMPIGIVLLNIRILGEFIILEMICVSPDHQNGEEKLYEKQLYFYFCESYFGMLKEMFMFWAYANKSLALFK